MPLPRNWPQNLVLPPDADFVEPLLGNFFSLSYSFKLFSSARKVILLSFSHVSWLQKKKFLNLLFWLQLKLGTVETNLCPPVLSKNSICFEDICLIIASTFERWNLSILPFMSEFELTPWMSLLIASVIVVVVVIFVDVVVVTYAAQF